MKRFALWFVLIVVVAIAAWLAVLHFKTASSALVQSVSPGALSPRHAYLGDRCAACHEPRIGVTVANCTTCHATAERLLGRQPTAFHASIQECAACHVEHQPASVRPLEMDHVELAKVGARTLAREARGHPDARPGRDSDSGATLASLQTWLRIRSPNRFDAISAREALDCAGCHDRQDPHSKRFGRDCAQCHGFESWSISGYQHPPSDSRQCVQCHRPPPSHLMGHFSMVSQKLAGKEHARVDQCYDCHNTTSWNDIVGVGYYKHH